MVGVFSLYFLFVEGITSAAAAAEIAADLAEQANDLAIAIRLQALAATKDATD